MKRPLKYPLGGSATPQIVDSDFLSPNDNFFEKKSDPNRVWNVSPAIFCDSPENLVSSQIPLVNCPVNFDRKNEVGEELEIESWSCNSQPSIGYVELTSTNHG